MNVKRCDIILPTCGQTALIKDCIESLIKSTRYPVRLIAIDNGASEEASSYLKEVSGSGRLDMVLIKPPENLGWIRSINEGLALSKDSEFVSFQNDDTVFASGWMEELSDVFAKDAGIGIANPEWELPEGQDVETRAGELKKYAGQTVDMDWCRGHCLVVKREVVDKIGGLDPVYIPVYYDDRDYSLKAIEAGYRCVKAKGAFVYHIRNVTMKKTMHQQKISALMERNGRIFYKRWGYPLRVVFALSDLAGSKGILRKMCMDQNKVVVLSRKGDKVPYEHTNIKILGFPGAFFGIAALLYIMSNRSRKHQKKTDFIFTDDRRFYSFLKPFMRFIPADVIFRDSVASLAEEAVRLTKEKKGKDKGSIV
ncbi:MAG: glycosyltransferase [Candidatus Omnitrophica bacterium]|nr:glycosyltransferase [Candidatus Omnitrophota bacterium]MDD5435952.1 glycosyltransferase [Candidatus Omnitrophota bacterium]